MRQALRKRGLQKRGWSSNTIECTSISIPAVDAPPAASRSNPSTPRLAVMMGGVCGGSLLLYLFVGLAGAPSSASAAAIADVDRTAAARDVN